MEYLITDVNKIQFENGLVRKISDYALREGNIVAMPKWFEVFTRVKLLGDKFYFDCRCQECLEEMLVSREGMLKHIEDVHGVVLEDMEGLMTSEDYVLYEEGDDELD